MLKLKVNCVCLCIEYREAAKKLFSGKNHFRNILANFRTNILGKFQNFSRNFSALMLRNYKSLIINSVKIN